MLGAVTAPSIRVAGGDDLPRIVEFQDRDARPAFVRSLAIARRFEAGNPQPDRLMLVAEDGDRIAAIAQVSEGMALGLKLTALAALKERGAALFGTTNDEANAAMQGVNARLGYVADPPQIEVEKVFEA